jgi:hypothetical protein
MAIPLQREGGQSQLHGGANFVLSCLIGGEQTDGIDLAAAMAFVLRGVKLVGGGCARLKTTMSGELAINFFRDFAGAAELAFDKSEHRDAFQG